MARVRVEAVGEHGHAEEQGAEDRAHPRHGRGRVLRLGRPEGGHPVGDGLDPGEGDRPRREPPQDQKDPERPAGEAAALEVALVERHRRQVAQVAACQPVSHQHGEDDDVGVHGDGEHRARGPHAAEVGDGDDGDQGQPQLDAPVHQAAQRRQRDHGGHARRDRHRHGQDVVDHQGGAGDESRVATEVLAAHDVGAAPARVGEDRLPVGDHDQRQQHGDDDRDRHQLAQAQGQARGPGGGDEEDLLGGVGRRRDGVGRERGQGQYLGQALLVLLGGREWPAHQHPLQQRHGRRLSHPDREESAGFR